MPENQRWPGWTLNDQLDVEEMINGPRARRVAERLREIIEEEGLDVTGRLKRSIRINERKGEVTLTAPYWVDIEYGRKPGGKMPPYRAIRKWVSDKFGLRQLGAPKVKGSWAGDRARRRRGHDVAWAIMQKIQKKGLPARHILEKAWRDVEDEEGG
jgi:hypothetical protein